MKKIARKKQDSKTHGSASALGGLRYIENSTEDEENAKHKKGQVNRLAEQEKAILTCIVTFSNAGCTLSVNTLAAAMHRVLQLIGQYANLL